ncbi:MAG: hypothetical protein V1664_05335 [Candidatus Uhrbacteria bacterium]
MKHQYIQTKFVPWLLVFGFFATAAGLIAVVFGIQSFIQGSVIELISILTWLVFLFIYWIAFFEKPIGNENFWKMLAPTLIIIDIVGIVLLSLADSAGIFEASTNIVVSIVLSLPLYIMTLWYALKFLPKIKNK